jgi:peptidyl-prolyl cis-trans isomerase B (cyclophilin B)
MTEMRAVKAVLLVVAVLLTGTVRTAAQPRAEVLLETSEGNVRLALYNETPLHRDNFLKLVRMHVYDSLLFHRVVKDFMIQGGDLNSKHARPGQRLGTGELDYTIEPEFRLPQYYHRRGVLAAAREPDEVNPEMRSGACQFYIVWGRQFNDVGIGKIQERLDTLTHGRVQLTEEMIETYKTVGGAPHLDGQYTVFGEVVDGLDVVGRIQQMPTDKYHRPVTDVRILRATIVNDPFAPKEEPKKEVRKESRKSAPAKKRPVSRR